MSVSVERAIVQAARAHASIPINTVSALYRFAKGTKLGHPRSDEYPVEIEGVAYTAQTYQKGIAYVKDGDWENCKFIATLPEARGSWEKS